MEKVMGYAAMAFGAVGCLVLAFKGVGFLARRAAQSVTSHVADTPEPAAATVARPPKPDPTESRVASASAPSSTASAEPKPQTPLDVLADQAERGSSFKVEENDEWALYPPGTTDCGEGEPGANVHVDRPKTDDQFELHDLLAKKGDIAKKYVGKLVKFTGGDGFGVALGNYNFTTHVYTPRVAADHASHWPLGGGSPTFSRDDLPPLTFDQEIGKIGGKSLTVERQQEMVSFNNTSSMSFSLKATESEARQMKDHASTDFLLLFRFKGLGLHKYCERTCTKMFGETTCNTLNNGFGEYYRADLIGYRVTVNDKVVAEKQPPSSVKK